MRNTMAARAPQTNELSVYPFITSDILRRDRNRRNAARFNRRVLLGVTPRKNLVSPQELSASRNDEDGGCLARLLNQLRIMGHAQREALSAFIASEVRLMNARMPMDPLREVFVALDAEEAGDVCDVTPQQNFNRNPNKETARILREALEIQRDETTRAIDSLKIFEDAQEHRA